MRAELRWKSCQFIECIIRKWKEQLRNIPLLPIHINLAHPIDYFNKLSSKFDFSFIAHDALAHETFWNNKKRLFANWLQMSLLCWQRTSSIDIDPIRFMQHNWIKCSLLLIVFASSNKSIRKNSKVKLRAFFFPGWFTPRTNTHAQTPTHRIECFRPWNHLNGITRKSEDLSRI